MLFEAMRSTVIKKNEVQSQEEYVIIERPFHILLNAVDLGASMVLPDRLEEFAVGFLYAQGYIESYNQIDSIRVCNDGSIFVYAKSVGTPESKESIVTSGCGGGSITASIIYGGQTAGINSCKLSIDDCTKLIKETTIKGLELSMKTHGVHIAGFFSEGKIRAFAADIGRHNAINKVMGRLLMDGVSTAGAIYTTGRLTSEMVAFAARIGIPILISRNAPSSLGIKIAERYEMTLISYARPGRLNIFNRPDRIIN